VTIFFCLIASFKPSLTNIDIVVPGRHNVAHSHSVFLSPAVAVYV